MTGFRKPLTQIVLPLCVVAGVAVTVAGSARTRLLQPPEARTTPVTDDLQIVQRIDRVFERQWSDAGVEPAATADELAILRRLSQVLHGTVPSLEEIRAFEADSQPHRLDRWIDQMLADRRFADYFAQRLARVYVGADDGQFVVFRRDRFWAWLGKQLQDNRPYDEVVREMIADRGLWTGVPQVNFVTAAVNDGNVDVNKLAGRTVRAFLGQRIDCAQCHNHPFADWKQSQFEGLAACFGQVNVSPVGVEDNRTQPYAVQDRQTLQDREVAVGVPFGPEWLPAEGTARSRLAHWVTHPENRRFERAIANRTWGLMFGKAWIEPVDDLPNPSGSGRNPDDVLDLLGQDFREHDCSLKRLIKTIASTRVFRLSSAHPRFESADGGEAVVEAWAAFPLTRLRPEQVIGSMLQASSIKTIDQNSHWVRRAFRFFQQLDFVREYGDLGENELEDHSGTIPQALLRMNGDFARERSESGAFTAPGRIMALAATEDSCLELCYLVCLTRRPTEEERQQFLPQFVGQEGDLRKDIVEDIFWTLYNSAEFNWGH